MFLLGASLLGCCYLSLLQDPGQIHLKTVWFLLPSLESWYLLLIKLHNPDRRVFLVLSFSVRFLRPFLGFRRLDSSATWFRDAPTWADRPRGKPQQGGPCRGRALSQSCRLPAVRRKGRGPLDSGWHPSGKGFLLPRLVDAQQEVWGPFLVVAEPWQHPSTVGLFLTPALGRRSRTSPERRSASRPCRLMTCDSIAEEMRGALACSFPREDGRLNAGFVGWLGGLYYDRQL